MIHADLVTVYHDDPYRVLAQDLARQLLEVETGFRFIGVDNRVHNRGFAAGCNLGALGCEDAHAPIVGFLNPDVTVHGHFLKRVREALTGPVVITGCRFSKPQSHLDVWGVTDWVCGAAMFVKRDWFQAIGGFDEQFQWSWEETDLIRQAEAQGLECRSIDLPIHHESPTTDDPEVQAYKSFHFTQGQRRFARKWQRRN